MSRNVVSAKLDIIFKKIFTENEDMLHSFVASMLISRRRAYPR